MPVVSSQAGYGVDIVVYGLAETERALRQVAPDVKKAMDKSIRAALGSTVSVARGRLPQSPMSGWRAGAAAKGRTRGGAGWPGWEPQRGAARITIRRGSAFRRGRGSAVTTAWRIQSDDAAATIFDKAAVGHSRSGKQFVANLDGFGKAQRVLWPAWLATRDEAMTKVQAAITQAEQHLQSIIDANDAVRAA